jgi:hypothetical protein
MNLGGTTKAFMFAELFDYSDSTFFSKYATALF